VDSEIRNRTTNDIAAGVINTDHNGERFFVRRVCFTGADEPYKKLKRTLRADIDEAAWSLPLLHRESPLGQTEPFVVVLAS
jgi:hypothetical protein